MKPLFTFASLLAISTLLYLPANVFAQDTLPNSDLSVLLLGRTIKTPAVEAIIGTEISEHFYAAQTYAGDFTLDDQAKPIKVSIINDASDEAQHLWVTTDGLNWRPYALAKKEYLTVRSNRSGIVGVFNGDSVRILNARGQYLASTLFL